MASGEAAGIRLEHVECDLCHSPLYNELYKKQVDGASFSIVRCAVCELVFLNPRPISEDIPRFYGEGYYSYQPPRHVDITGGRSFGGRTKAHALRSFGYAHSPTASPWVKAAAPLVKRLLSVPKFKRGGNLLDVGCGTGEKLGYFQSLGWRVTGLEISEQAAATGRKAGFDIRSAMIEDAPFENEQFDAITFYHSLEHVYSPSRVLKKVRTWLKPGGEVVIVAPNFNCTERKIFGGQWSWLDVPVHLYHYTPKTLSRLLEEAMLPVEEIGYSAAGRSAEFPRSGVRMVDSIGRTFLRGAGLACASLGDGKAIIARATRR